MVNGNLLSSAINLVYECCHASKSLVTPSKSKNDCKPNNSIYQSKEEKKRHLYGNTCRNKMWRN